MCVCVLVLTSCVFRWSCNRTHFSAEQDCYGSSTLGWLGVIKGWEGWVWFGVVVVCVLDVFRAVFMRVFGSGLWDWTHSSSSSRYKTGTETDGESDGSWVRAFSFLELAMNHTKVRFHASRSWLSVLSVLSSLIP